MSSDICTGVTGDQFPGRQGIGVATSDLGAVNGAAAFGVALVRGIGGLAFAGSIGTGLKHGRGFFAGGEYMMPTPYGSEPQD